MSRCSILFLVAFAAVLSACSSTPAVKESRVIARQPIKLNQIDFVYQHYDLKESWQQLPEHGVMKIDGYPELGQILARTAPSAFAAAGVDVHESKTVSSEEKIPASNKPLLFVRATKGSVMTNREATVVGVLFRASLIDPPSKRVLWEASIDTSTWYGVSSTSRDRLYKSYDEGHVARILELIVAQMKQDDMI